MSVVTIFGRDGYKDKVLKRVADVDFLHDKVIVTFKSGRTREIILDKSKYSGSIMTEPDNLYDNSMDGRTLLVFILLLLVILNFISICFTLL